MSETDLCLKELGFNSQSWPAPGFAPQPWIDKVWVVLRKLDLKPLTETEGVNLTELYNVDKPMARGAFRSFSTDKIEKIGLMWIIFAKSIVGGALLGWPRDGYDFPVLCIAWEETKKRLHIIIDLWPLTDCVVNEWYREKYLDGLDPVWREFRDIRQQPSTYVWARAIAGPMSIFDDTSDRPRALECELKYIDYWVTQVVPKSEPVKDPTHMEYVNKRKKAIRDQFRARDPLGSVIIRTMGPELGKKAILAYL
jgi:hypothetical protein